MQSERLIQISTEKTTSHRAFVLNSRKAVQVRDLSKSFNGKRVLQNVSFSVGEGESLVLLGESGSGKTTILRIIAGLETPDHGQVVLHGKNVTDMPTRERNVGLIFQNYSLFPRMTAEENISFGLRIRGKSQRDTRAVVDKLIGLVRLEEHRKKLPSQLSGGQQQRVAIARALAYDPEVLFFDEPFAALDANTRSRVRQEVVALLKQQNVPSIFITHDCEEALEIGDRIAVLNNGVLEQIGTPREIYDYPQTEYVASFAGRANVIPGVVRGANIETTSAILPAYRETQGFNEGQPVKIVFRPEDVSLNKTGYTSTDERQIAIGVIEGITFAGSCERARIKLNARERPSFSGHLAVRRSDLGLNKDRTDVTIIADRTRAEAAAFSLVAGDRVTVSLRSFRLIPSPLSRNPK